MDGVDNDLNRSRDCGDNSSCYHGSADETLDHSGAWEMSRSSEDSIHRQRLDHDDQIQVQPLSTENLDKIPRDEQGMMRAFLRHGWDNQDDLKSQGNIFWSTVTMHTMTWQDRLIRMSSDPHFNHHVDVDRRSRLTRESDLRLRRRKRREEIRLLLEEVDQVFRVGEDKS